MPGSGFLDPSGAHHVSTTSQLAQAVAATFIWLASMVVGLHFLAVVMLVLAAQSGPWTTRFGDSTAEGPLFAAKINNVMTPAYLQPLRMTHNYHFLSNRLTLSEVFFEARLKDDKGNVTTLTFPEEGANSWMRQRENLLALGLGDDVPVQAPRGEVIPAPGRRCGRSPSGTRPGRQHADHCGKCRNTSWPRTAPSFAPRNGRCCWRTPTRLPVPRLRGRLGGADPPQQGSGPARGDVPARTAAGHIQRAGLQLWGVSP